ncbi:MAG TPA: metallophosphoesterase family protein [Verrucomicrobiae bacterium]
MRTSRLALLPWLTLALFIATGPRLFAEPPDTNRFSIITGPVLQSPSETSMAVTWITSRDATAAVEYGPPGGALKTAFSSRDGLVDGVARVHRVVLPELQPGTAYCYRVVSREITGFRQSRVEFGETIASAFHEFRTFDRRKRDFSFVVFNDLHDQPATIPELLKVAGTQPYDFVLLNGDILSYIADEGQIAAVFDQAAGFASAIPLVWVRGNHETRGRFARQLPAYLASPNGRYYYAFDHGPVRFIVLDGGEDKVDGHREYGGLADFFRYRHEQAAWLKAEVKTKAFRQAKYRVVFCHMPFPNKIAADPSRYNEPNTFLGMADAFEQFGATLDHAGVDLMLSGHTHAAAVIPPEPGRHRYPIVQGGGPRGTDRTVIRVNVSRAGLEAAILRPDGTSLGVCRVAARR